MHLLAGIQVVPSNYSVTKGHHRNSAHQQRNYPTSLHAKVKNAILCCATDYLVYIEFNI